MLCLYGRSSELPEFSQLTPGGGTITILALPACILSHVSCVQLFATPWTVARQAPLSMGLSRQERWSGLPCPPPETLPRPGLNLGLLHWQEVSSPLASRGKPMLMYVLLYFLLIFLSLYLELQFIFISFYFLFLRS